MEKDVLINLDNNELMDLWNDMCDDYNWFEDKVYFVDEIDAVLSFASAREVLHMVEGNDFNLYDTFFKYDTDDISSSDYLEDLIDIDELYDYLNEE